MAAMELSGLTPQPDFTLTAAFGIPAVVAFILLAFLYMDYFMFEGPLPPKLLRHIGTGLTVILVAGVVGAAATGLWASNTALKDREARFHQALQATYGASTDADMPTANSGTSVPVHTEKGGNELVTFRETGGQLVAFRVDGTELPRG